MGGMARGGSGGWGWDWTLGPKRHLRLNRPVSLVAAQRLGLARRDERGVHVQGGGGHGALGLQRLHHVVDQVRQGDKAGALRSDLRLADHGKLGVVRLAERPTVGMLVEPVEPCPWACGGP